MIQSCFLIALVKYILLLQNWSHIVSQGDNVVWEYGGFLITSHISFQSSSNFGSESFAGFSAEERHCACAHQGVVRALSPLLPPADWILDHLWSPPLIWSSLQSVHFPVTLQNVCYPVELNSASLNCLLSKFHFILTPKQVKYLL